MKIAAMISRYLLGLVFVMFGVNGFFPFLPMGSVPPIAMQFFGALAQSHYMSVVFALEIICGLLLLGNFYVPLALTVLGAVIVNILLFHIFMAPAGLPLALLVVVLWGVVAYQERSAFAGILRR